MTHRIASTVLAACALFFSSGNRASAQDFRMLFQNHRITLIARDMTVARILDRWSQIGGTVVVNGAAVRGGPVSLQLNDVPEREALEILLRSVDGYIVAERDDDSAGASSISKILILPVSASTRERAPSISAAFDPAGSAASVDAQAQQVFVQPTPEFVQPASPSPAAPASVPPASLPILGGGGTTRPGEVTAPLPELYKPGATPTQQPGQAPPPVPTIQPSRPPIPPGTIVP